MTIKKKKTTNTDQQKNIPQTPITVDEFKSWLSGVEDMQEVGWSPDKVQWKKIRDKIDLLYNTIPVLTQTVESYPTQYVQSMQQHAPIRNNDFTIPPKLGSDEHFGMPLNSSFDAFNGPAIVDNGENYVSPFVR